MGGPPSTFPQIWLLLAASFPSYLRHNSGAARSTQKRKERSYEKRMPREQRKHQEAQRQDNNERGLNPRSEGVGVNKSGMVAGEIIRRCRYD